MVGAGETDVRQAAIVTRLAVFDNVSRLHAAELLHNRHRVLVNGFTALNDALTMPLNRRNSVLSVTDYVKQKMKR